MYYIYLYIDPRTNMPFYVGKGKDDRKYTHLTETLSTTINKRKYFKIQSIFSAGLTPIIEEVAIFDDELLAYELEAKLIQQYGRIGYDKAGILTNICTDARPPIRKGAKLTEEQKIKFRKPLSEERKNKLKGNIPWNKGKKGLQVSWCKGRTDLIGHPCSAETKEKLKQFNIGKKKSLTTIEKMKEGWSKKKQKGYTPWNKGKSMPPSAKAVACIFIAPDGTEYTYPSFRQGCIFHRLPANKISEVNTGILTNYKGWTVHTINKQVQIQEALLLEK